MIYKFKFKEYFNNQKSAIFKTITILINIILLILAKFIKGSYIR
jgi:hypothetical protein